MFKMKKKKNLAVHNLSQTQNRNNRQVYNEKLIKNKKERLKEEIFNY